MAADVALALPVAAPIPAPSARAIAKRAIDILGAALGLILLAPLLAVVVLLIRLDSPGPVIFAHRRLGRDGRRFDCFKFRSMRVDAERTLDEDEGLRDRYVRNHYKIPTDQDPRVTRLGRLLRKSSVDEIPQLWNVLVGDMSLVGPRPIVDDEACHYEGALAELLSMRPGLSGAWAVHGRSRVGYPERAELELSYVRDWSVSTDLAILARTPWAVITGRGVE